MRRKKKVCSSGGQGVSWLVSDAIMEFFLLNAVDIYLATCSAAFPSHVRRYRNLFSVFILEKFGHKVLTL